MDFESAGLTLGVLASADICLRTGHNLCQRYKEIRDADKEIDELNDRVEKVWLQIEYQLQTVKHSEGEVPQDWRDQMADLLNKLQYILHTGGKHLDKLSQSRGKSKVIKFALFSKNSLEKDVSALEKWRTTFTSIFFMLSLPVNPRLDRILSMQVQTNPGPAGSDLTRVKAIRDVLAEEPTKQFEPVWLPAVPMYFSNPIGFSGAHVVFDNTTNTKYIMETITFDPGRSNLEQLDRDVTKLARVLRESKGVPGVLTCKGVVRRGGHGVPVDKFELILEMPPALGDNPDCLRTVLLKSQHEPHPLDERFLLANQVAKAVMFVHSLNFVHKNMRPDTILCFPNPGKTLGIPFLVGYQMFRSADGLTYMAGDDVWSKDLYRHPSRQGILPGCTYIMHHDIYSLGVVLLEIGMWASFVDGHGEPTAALSSIVPILHEKDKRKKAMQIKKKLVSMAWNELPQRMGTRYAEIVVSCLSCLDTDSEFGGESEFVDDDGILVGLRYNEQILSQLDAIEV
ncbi:hypothetical protein L873DRAFT_68918 [Choiromyces venosus 120613-1]|uniref:Protein kinase domain-containing protein n=1 Tax=Choiromyces venosus 120613-1 TaxID=1336337 RepID=A0A3N4J7N0_9PEZI|nr:hypothetical protein L873DRAFT_68918 [Choiromyces venosus 120613-1]